MATKEETLGRYDGAFGDINRQLDDMQTGVYQDRAEYNDKYVMDSVVDANKGNSTDYVMDTKTYDEFKNSEYANKTDGIEDFAKENDNVQAFSNTQSAVNAMNAGTIGSEVRELTALNHDEVVALCNRLKEKDENLETVIKNVEQIVSDLENNVYTPYTIEQIKNMRSDIENIRKHLSLMDEIIKLFNEYADTIEDSSSSLNGGRY